MSARQEVSTGDWDVVDLDLSYDQVILGLCWHRRLPNTYNLREEGVVKCVSLQMNCDEIILTFDSVSDTLTNLWQCTTESTLTARYWVLFFYTLLKNACKMPSWQESKLCTKRVMRFCQKGPALFIGRQPLIQQRPFWHTLITLSMQSFKSCHEEGGIPVFSV